MRRVSPFVLPCFEQYSLCALGYESNIMLTGTCPFDSNILKVDGVEKRFTSPS